MIVSRLWEVLCIMFIFIFQEKDQKRDTRREGGTLSTNNVKNIDLFVLKDCVNFRQT